VHHETFRNDHRLLTSLLSRFVDQRGSQLSLQKVALLGHHISGDLEILKRYGFCSSKLPFVIGTIDTDVIAKHNMGFHCDSGLAHTHSLDMILKVYQIRFLDTERHSAGNDATLTLLALFRMAARHFKVQKAQESLSPEQKYCLKWLEAIEAARLPPEGLLSA
jgi:hypothetical protein